MNGRRIEPGRRATFELEKVACDDQAYVALLEHANHQLWRDLERTRQAMLKASLIAFIASLMAIAGWGVWWFSRPAAKQNRVMPGAVAGAVARCVAVPSFALGWRGTGYWALDGRTRSWHAGRVALSEPSLETALYPLWQTSGEVSKADREAQFPGSSAC